MLLTRSPYDRGRSPEKVLVLYWWQCCKFDFTSESGCLKVQPKAGDKLHLRLNIDTNPIANKYREGKLQRTLKREFKRT